MKKLSLLIVVALSAVVLMGCGLFRSDPISASIQVTPVETEDNIVLFVGEYNDFDFPDEELGISVGPDYGNTRLRWPINGNNRSLSLLFEFETVDVSRAQALLIGFDSEDSGVRLGSIVFHSEDGREWKHRPGALGGAIALPTDGYEIDLIEVPTGIRGSLTGIEINMFDSFSDAEIILGDIWISK